MKSLFLPALFLLLAPLQAEETISSALKTAQKDLTTTLSALEKTRTDISSEKPALTEDFQKIEQELLEKRRLVRIARLSEADRAQELRQLQADLSTRRQDASYLAAQLKDHALKITTLTTPGSPRLDVSPDIIATDSTDPAASITARLPILDSAISRMESLLGGSSSPGEAADPDGAIHTGTLAALGPVSYFLSTEKTTGGDIIPTQPGNPLHFYPTDTASIATLLAGKEATLPLDPTGGDARAMEQLGGGPLDLIRKGGLWIWPIICLAILSLIFGIIKLAQFAKLREPTEAWVNAILAALRTGDQEKATQLAIGQAHPAGPVMKKLINASETTADLVEETLYEQLMAVQAKAGTLLPVIAITAATAPLIGLLGTVSGMITTFNLITLFGSGDPKPLAGGISEALITTLFGLVVAIPALVLHAFLSRRAQGITQTTERLGLSFVNGLRAKL